MFLLECSQHVSVLHIPVRLTLLVCVQITRNILLARRYQIDHATKSTFLKLMKRINLKKCRVNVMVCVVLHSLFFFSLGWHPGILEQDPDSLWLFWYHSGSRNSC